MSPRTAERRSPLALAHDPPVHRHDWVAPRDLDLDAFLADARTRLACDDAAFERLLRHGGFHLDRVRLVVDEAPPAVILAGTTVVAYAYEREPLPLVLPDAAILHDGDGIVAISKPPWWAVQGTRASRLVSLERELRRRLGCRGLAPVHRLDRETTGVQVFARDPVTAGALGRQFAARTVRKDYLAVVAPTPEADELVVSGAMVRALHPSHSLFELSADDAAGPPSETRFEVLARGVERALVRAVPATGRTHQIRVHLAASGTPIVGDSLYGAGWLEGDPRSAQRLQLHAERLAFDLLGRRQTLEAPPPADFEAVEPTIGPS